MKIQFSKNSLPGSKLIMWGLNEPVSHLSICFDDFLVFHSQSKGVNLTSLPYFKEHNEIVYSVKPKKDLSLVEEEKLYQMMIPLFEGSGYDWGSLLYFAYRGTLNKFFNKPIPKKSKWGSNKAYLCSEMAGVLDDVFYQSFRERLLPVGIDLGIISPYQIYKILKQSPNIVEE